MKKLGKVKGHLFVVLLVAMLTFSSNAFGFSMRLTDMNTLVTVTIVDNDGIWDTNTAQGAITFHPDPPPPIPPQTYTNPFPNWFLNVTTGLSQPITGLPGGIAMIDLNSVLYSVGAGTLKIELSDTGFFVTGQEFGLTLKNNFGGTTGGSVTVEGNLDRGNNLWGNDISVGPFTVPNPGSFYSESVDVSGFVSQFSLSEIVTITHTAGQCTSFNKELSASAIPEPATMLLLGTGLVGLAGFGRKKFLKK
jgi:hypothetical protein